MVIIITKSFLEITIPKKTPARLNTTEDKIITGDENALNWETKISSIKKTANNNALLKKANSFSWSSICPVNL